MIRLFLALAPALSEAVLDQAESDTTRALDTPSEAALPVVEPTDVATEPSDPVPEQALSDDGLSVAFTDDALAEPDSNQELFGFFGVEGRLFPLEPLRSEQIQHVDGSLVLSPTYMVVPADHWAFRATAFARIDWKDRSRTHADVREAYWEAEQRPFVWRLGMQQVFWGVTESRHLVDIVNQMDLLEGFDTEARLGQLAGLTQYGNATLGSVSVLFMTWFRPLEFPGLAGRPTLALPVLEPHYESVLERWHPDAAVRWSKTLGAFDVAVSYFSGTSREPELEPTLTPNGPALRPRYSVIRQLGLELQWTVESWLIKHEALLREGQGPTFWATTSGFEYDLSEYVEGVQLVMEYSNDRRENHTLNLFQNDLFVAGRLSLNDDASTEFNLGSLVDLDDGSVVGQLEASRRLGDYYKLMLEARLILPARDTLLLDWLRRDHSVDLKLRYYY